MPLLDASLEQNSNLNTSHYGYSGTRIQDLGASEYTIVTVAVDVSGSVGGLEKDLEKAVKAVVGACKYSPRADNLLIRIVSFNHNMNELHGFKLLQNCNEADYTSILRASGSTALYDATANAIEATTEYGKKLYNNQFTTNGIVVVITDGCESGDSKLTENGVKKLLGDAIRAESLESLKTILIGINVQSSYVSTALKAFKDGVGFDQYEEVDNADAKTLAKVADFVSKSISAQSQALGTGGPSQSLTL